MEFYNNNFEIKIKIQFFKIFIFLITFIIKKNNNFINPKISLFLPIYNKSKYLKRSIESIQKQTLKEIEIIAVNDCSEDNSLKILKKMAKIDYRIKIINNDRNRGLLYSRAIGIINCRGEYLMNLDPDDELSYSNNLKYLYNLANKLKIDVISFGFIQKFGKKLQKFIKCSNYKNILFYPELFNSGNRNDDYLITNKLIKNEIFIKAYKFFQSKIIGEKWNFAEDEIWSTLIYKYAKSMICVNKIIFFYYSNKDSLTKNRYNCLYLKNLISWVKMFQTISKKKEYEKYIINRTLLLIDIIKNDNKFLDIIKSNNIIRKKYILFFLNKFNDYYFKKNNLKK